MNRTFQSHGLPKRTAKPAVHGIRVAIVTGKEPGQERMFAHQVPADGGEDTEAPGL